MPGYVVRFGHHRTRHFRTFHSAYEAWLYPPKLPGGEDDTATIIREREGRTVLVGARHGVYRDRLTPREAEEMETSHWAGGR